MTVPTCIVEDNKVFVHYYALCSASLQSHWSYMYSCRAIGNRQWILLSDTMVSNFVIVICTGTAFTMQAPYHHTFILRSTQHVQYSMLPSVLVMSMQTNMQQDNANYLHSQNNTAYIEQLGDKVRTSYIMGVILQSFKCHIQHIFTM